MSRSVISAAVLVFGGTLLVLVVLSGFISVVTWQADLYAIEENINTAEAVAADELPGECSRFAQSLAASQNVSIKGYRIGIGSMNILLRKTPGKEWMVGDTNCGSELASKSHLQVEKQAYNIDGQYTESKLHNKPRFHSGQLLGGLVGLGMLVIGYKMIQRSETE